ncbi:MAG: hypothetical protein A2W28_09180 [Gammaproteobacteria bacterium RBG_16_51_14]|nr:MAG: hypothetical protein A2W28_09180 [Gammaproteobacteria bacterium RBG_16_51_14]
MMMTNREHRSFLQGQAMTELLITASMLLVPLLLLIPLLGKYIDIKHSTIEAARYEAWEYTVWYNGTNNGQADDRPDGYPNAQPVKGLTQTQIESRRRFFSDITLPIANDDKTIGWRNEPGKRNPLWLDHEGRILWDGTIDAGTLPKNNEPTPDFTGGVMNLLMDIIQIVFDALKWALSLAGSNVGFTAINNDGYINTTVTAPVLVPVGLINMPNMLDTPGVDDSTAGFMINFSSSAAVLSEGWNAGGLEHTTNQAGGLVPTKLLDTLLDSIPAVKTVFNGVLGTLVPELRLCNPGFPHPLGFDKPFVEPDDGSLWLGYMDIDAVPPDRLDMDGDGNRDTDREKGQANGITCEDGMCDYNMTGATYTGPTPFVQGMSKSPCDT